MKRKLTILAAMCLAATPVSAAVVINGTSVVGTLTHGTAYGGCMIEIPPGQGSTDLVSAGCDGQYVSAGCAGDPAIGISKANAAANFSSAQLALVTGYSVDLVIEESLTYNGSYCVVTQVITRPPAP